MAISVKTYSRLDEAVAAMSTEQSARVMGGGTLMMRGVNHGTQSVSTIVRITDASLKQIRSSGGRIQIGAAASMSDILGNQELDFLHSAAKSVGGPAIRNMATVGGNLFARAPFGDLTTALVAADTTVASTGGYGGGEVPLEEFLANRNRGTAGIVTHVSVSRPASPDAFRFIKISRIKPKGGAVLSIAAHLPNSGGRIQGARVVYGGMAPTSMRASGVERALEGQTLNEAGIAGALAVATEGCNPANDEYASAWYRMEVAPVHLRRLLLGESR